MDKSVGRGFAKVGETCKVYAFVGLEASVQLRKSVGEPPGPEYPTA
jgi:hypothetical protein